jgi:gluconate 2-dehydrogenase alpha chain
MADGIVDVCLIGVGAAGGILAKELGAAGLKVAAFERGSSLTQEDYAVRDAIRFITRAALVDWARHDPVTFRNFSNQRATARYITINALGGQMLHWTAQAARFRPDDFQVFGREIAGGVADQAKADLTGYEIFDWPIGYDDLEPYYEKFEWEFGVSGAGGNPFAGSRKRDYPLPPLRRSAKMQLFEKACRSLGYHPYQSAAGILSQPYRPPPPYDTRIEERPACTYCGHCNEYGCHVNAKAAPLYTSIPAALKTGNVELHTNSRVFRINKDGSGRATGISYFAPDKEIKEQRARVTILCGYAFKNSRLLLLSKQLRSYRPWLHTRGGNWFERRWHAGAAVRRGAARHAKMGRELQEFPCTVLHPDFGN